MLNMLHNLFHTRFNACDHPDKSETSRTSQRQNVMPIEDQTEWSISETYFEYGRFDQCHHRELSKAFHYGQQNISTTLIPHLYVLLSKSII